MESWMLTKLDQSMIDLSKSLDINDILLRLRVSNIFDDYDKELVMNDCIHKTDFDKRLKIIELLRTRGPKAYWKFCHYIRQRSPNIFKRLHDEESNEYGDKFCPVCNPQDDSQVYESPKCDYCTGLISVFSTCEKDVYVEDIESLVDVFLLKDRIISSLRYEGEIKDKEILRLKNDNQLLSERNTINLSQIAIKEEDLKSKERKFIELTLLREDLLMEKEEMQMTLKEHAETIKELEQQLNIYRQKYKDAVKIENESNILDQDPNYVNKEVYWKQKSAQLECEMQDAENQISSIKKMLINEQKQSAHLKIQKEAAEELYEHVKSENKRVSQSFGEQLKLSQKESVTSQVKIEDMEHKIHLLQQMSEEQLLEKIHLVEKLYEKERCLKEMKDRLETSQKDCKSLKELYDIKCGNVNTLVGSREDITSQLRAVLNERNAERKKNSELLEAKDELVHKLIALQRKEENIQKEIESRQMYVTTLEEDCERFRKKIDQICELHAGDYEVTLNKISPNERFGVSFGVVKGLVKVSESRIMIAAINYNSRATPLADISVGDYVIKINDVPVQDSDILRVKEIEQYNQKSMNLVLRKPRVSHDKLVQLAIHPDSSGIDGLKFALVATTTSNCDSWFNRLDEIVQVGGVSAETLCIDDINSKIRKNMKKRSPLEILVKREVEEVIRITSSQHLHPNESNKIKPPPPYLDTGYNKQSSTQEETSEGAIKSTTSVSRQNSSARPLVTRSCQDSLELNEYRHMDSLRLELETVKEQLPPQIKPMNNNSTYPLPLCTPHQQRVNEERCRSNQPPLPTRQSSGHINELLFSERRENGYTYVVSQKFDEHGNPIFSESNEYENEMTEIVLKKKPHVDYGFQIIGGNKVGIYIKSVDQWSAAYDAKFEVGWRIMKVYFLHS